MKKPRFSSPTEAVLAATHGYVATAPCGCVCGVMIDVPGMESTTAKGVAAWIRRGDTVQRVTKDETKKAVAQMKCDHNPQWKAPAPNQQLTMPEAP